MIYKNQDCIEFLKSLDDNVVDLICTDPPYYRVVNDEWDNQWFIEMSHKSRIFVSLGPLETMLAMP